MQSILFEVDLKEYRIVQFSSKRIVVIHKPTHKLFTYHQRKFDPQQLNHLSSAIPHLATPTIIPPIILYPKFRVDLRSLLATKRSSRKSDSFTSEQIINTFAPIVQCVKFLHQQKFSHRFINSQTVVIDELGNVKLKDWLIPNLELSSYYYDKKIEDRNQRDDWKSLAYLIIQTATLVQIQQIVEDPLKFIKVLEKCHQKNLAKALAIMIKGDQLQISSIQQIFQNGFRSGTIQEIKKQDILQKDIRKGQTEYVQIDRDDSQDRKAQASKQIFSNSTLAEDKDKKLNGFQRKFVIKTPTKKQSKIENYENKRFNQQIKKRGQSERTVKASKIKERSNAIVNQAISKKIGESQKIIEAQSICIKNLVLGVQNGQTKAIEQDYSKICSSSKRKTTRRFFSKKK